MSTQLKFLCSSPSKWFQIGYLAKKREVKVKVSVGEPRDHHCWGRVILLPTKCYTSGHCHKSPSLHCRFFESRQTEQKAFYVTDTSHLSRARLQSPDMSVVILVSSWWSTAVSDWKWMVFSSEPCLRSSESWQNVYTLQMKTTLTLQLLIYTVSWPFYGHYLIP